MVKSVKELINELLPKYRAMNNRERQRLARYLEDYLFLNRMEYKQKINVLLS